MHLVSLMEAIEMYSQIVRLESTFRDDSIGFAPTDIAKNRQVTAIRQFLAIRDAGCIFNNSKCGNERWKSFWHSSVWSDVVSMRGSDNMWFIITDQIIKYEAENLKNAWWFRHCWWPVFSSNSYLSSFQNCIPSLYLKDWALLANYHHQEPFFLCSLNWTTMASNILVEQLIKLLEGL